VPLAPARSKHAKALSGEAIELDWATTRTMSDVVARETMNLKIPATSLALLRMPCCRAFFAIDANVAAQTDVASSLAG
jgi:hypothetical protein